ncbi:hypothetical protein ACFCYB_41430 [Streptomyces sp. NPDC056309]|uniref:hypothetical protein n=1 Tax=unclassified Streptomyces TaxID=2593676 RepID=UPI0035DE0667
MRRYLQADHQAVAANSQQTPGAWILAALYDGRMTGQSVARMIRNGTMAAYRPAGSFDAYEAMHDGGSAVWVRYVAGLDVVPMSDTLTVRVPDYGPQRAYVGVCIRTVDISSRCRRCGGPRGPVRAQTIVKDGSRLVCDAWENACGHQDDYRFVLAEARALAERGPSQRAKSPKTPPIRGVEGGRYAAAVDLIAELIQEKPPLRALRVLPHIEAHGLVDAAQVIRYFVADSATGSQTSARSAALHLIELDEKDRWAAEAEQTEWQDGPIGCGREATHTTGDNQ